MRPRSPLWAWFCSPPSILPAVSLCYRMTIWAGRGELIEIAIIEANDRNPESQFAPQYFSDHPSTVVGGAIHAADCAVATGKGDLTAAYNDAAARPTPTVISGDLGGQTLAPGLYKSTISIGITGILKLD